MELDDWMAVRDREWSKAKGTMANEHATLQTINIHLDSLVSHAQKYDELRKAANEMLERHKAAQEEWEGVVRTSSPTAELRAAFKTKVLRIMSQFCGRVVHLIHLKNSHYHGSTVVPPLTCPDGEVSNAEAVYYALTIMGEALAVCCDLNTTNKLQDYFLEEGIIGTLIAMYNIPREVELRRYGEGYKTCIMRVIANSSYENHNVTAYLLEHGFVPSILSATKIDEENAGLREWAEFTIRNITAYPPVVTFIRELKAQRISPESAKELAKTGIRVSNPECPKISPVNPQ
eukprot:TRINITY_DN33295_c0_g1_i1.p1 TRINITY_DN33295_c0_g1~~TRINITY_DN33295_c0_g1_i1.p1  ORF type:complete len:289 (+),score=80.57 TRINITY_DN33295_c0_g1_i1:43-909(+)